MPLKESSQSSSLPEKTQIVWCQFVAPPDVLYIHDLKRFHLWCDLLARECVKAGKQQNR